MLMSNKVRNTETEICVCFHFMKQDWNLCNPTNKHFVWYLRNGPGFSIIWQELMCSGRSEGLFLFVAKNRMPHCSQKHVMNIYFLTVIHELMNMTVWSGRGSWCYSFAADSVLLVCSNSRDAWFDYSVTHPGQALALFLVWLIYPNLLYALAVSLWIINNILIHAISSFV